MLWPLHSVAQSVPYAPPSNVVSLAATATRELTMDWLSVAFGTTREGADPTALQGQLRQALDAALSEARRLARPDEVLVRTGTFGISPRYGSNGAVTGWQGTAELIIEGRDTASIAQAMGRIRTLTVSRVGWSLSREAREKVESEVTAEAIARFRARADEVARHFGMAGYTLREVAVSGGDPEGGPHISQMAMRTASAMADVSLPVEAGKARVSIAVNGTVQLR